MLSKSLENIIKKEAFSFLEQGKKNWDVPHTISAVKWMKLLIAHEGGDERILIPAIYLHDTGYQNLTAHPTFENATKAHLGHAERGSKIAKSILSNLNKFSDNELLEIARLVAVHDKHPAPNDYNHQLIFEADGLAQIDWHDCKPTFVKKDSLRFLNEDFYKWRVAYYKTKTGKNYLKQQIKSARLYLEDRSE